MSVQELLSNINQEDQTVPLAVEKALPQIEAEKCCLLSLHFSASFASY